MCLPLRALVCLLLLALPLHLPAQQRLATARQRSYLTKVFRLTDAQTRQLYETDLTRARPEFFTQPVDSFPTDSAALGQRRSLPPGYYLVAHTEGAQLVYWLRAVTDRQITLLDSQTDLTLLVRDSLGCLLENARVAASKASWCPLMPPRAPTACPSKPTGRGCWPWSRPAALRFMRWESDPLPTLLDEIRHVQRYAYLCNEQAASKLKTLLLEQRIREQLKQPFEGEKDVNRLIRHLLRGRHQPDGLWGTWPGAAVSPWATLHVVEALLEATQQGYAVKLDRDALRSYLLRQLDVAFADAAARAALAATPTGPRYETLYFRSDDDRIRLLQLLHRLGAQPDFRTYVLHLEREAPAGKKVRQPLDRYLALANLRQQLGLPFQLDTLRRYRLRTELGGVFYADTLRDGAFYRYLLPDRTANTLLAYRLLRAHGGQEAELTRIRTYLLQQRRSASHWGSTYEAALILETIVPDLLVAVTKGLMARAQLSGAISQEVSKFPFEATVAAGAGPLVLRKEGGLPVYATAYQSFWNAAPMAVAAPFGVRTALAGQEGSRILLKAGQPAELLVTVDVKAEARYVLLEVPIPAGCSYGEKAPGNSFEVRREYLLHQVGIFIDVLPIGRHTFRVALQPRYRGRYTLNPAKAELMYFPTRFGRSASKQAVVE